MLRLVSPVLLVFAFAFAFNASTVSAAQPQSPQHCSPKGYSHSRSKCGLVPPGKFNLAIPQSGLSLTGIGSPRTVGAQVIVVRFPTGHTPLRGVAFRVIVKGSIPTLRASQGVLYRYFPTTNRVTRVNAISGPGIYEILPH